MTIRKTRVYFTRFTQGRFQITEANNFSLAGAFRHEIQSPGRFGFVAKFAGGGTGGFYSGADLFRDTERLDGVAMALM